MAYASRLTPQKNNIFSIKNIILIYYQGKPAKEKL
jgi:hypothetical protein